METIKSYTDISQSKKLAEILPIESADCCYIKYCTSDNNEWRYEGQPPMLLGEIPITEITAEHIPCWSLAALLNVLPKPKVFYSTDKANRWYCGCWDSDGNFITFTKAGNPIDACYEMVIRLHKLNLL